MLKRFKRASSVRRKAQIPQSLPGLIGVSLKVLTELAERAGSTWTIGDLLQNVVRPETNAKKKSYAEMLKSDQTSDDFIFISAPRSSNFKDLVEAIEHRCADNIKNEQQYCWLDVLCLDANTPLMSEETVDLMKSIIHYVDRLFVYFDGTKSPAALKRTWCLWEVYCALKTVVKTDMIFPFGFRKKTLRMLEHDFDGTVANLAKVDWSSSVSTFKTDKEMMESHLQKDHTRKNVDKLIYSELYKAALQHVERLVKELKHDPSSVNLRITFVKNLGLSYKNKLNLPYKAQPYLREALKHEEELYGLENEVSLKTLIMLAQVQFDLRKFVEAESLYRRVLNTFDRRIGRESKVAAAVLLNLSEVLREQGKLEKAEEKYREVLRIRRKLGDTTESIVDALRGLAETMNQQRKYAEAGEHLAEAQTLLEESDDAGSQGTVATIVSLHAAVLEKLERHNEAEVKLEESLQLRRKVFGSSHPTVATSLIALGGFLTRHHRHAEAITRFEQALSILVGSYGANHILVATTKSSLALVLQNLKKFEEAEALLKDSLQTERAVLGKSHVQTATNLSNLGNLYRIQGRNALAEQCQSEALKVLKGTYGEMHPKTALALWNLAVIKKLTGNPQEAEETWKQALNVYENTVGSDDPECVRCKEWWS